MHRFFNGDVNFDTDEGEDETPETTAETITTEDLFDDKGEK